MGKLTGGLESAVQAAVLSAGCRASIERCRRSTISRPSCRAFRASAGRRRCGSPTTCCASRRTRPSGSPRRWSRSASGCGRARDASISPKTSSARSAAIRGAMRRSSASSSRRRTSARSSAPGEFRGLYHVLGGRLSPLDGVGPDDLTVERARRTRVGDRRQRGPRGDPRDESEPRGRGDGAVRPGAARADAASRCRGSRAGCRWAAISNTPTA